MSGTLPYEQDLIYSKLVKQQDIRKAANLHVKLADRAVRTGDTRMALEHYRAARVLLEV